MLSLGLINLHHHFQCFHPSLCSLMVSILPVTLSPVVSYYLNCLQVRSLNERLKTTALSLLIEFACNQMHIRWWAKLETDEGIPVNPQQNTNRLAPMTGMVLVLGRIIRQWSSQRPRKVKLVNETIETIQQCSLWEWWTGMVVPQRKTVLLQDRMMQGMIMEKKWEREERK